MIKAKGKLSRYYGLIFCFFAAVVIAVAALNIGLLTKPEQFLPKGLTMRSEKMNLNIIHGIDTTLEDLQLIRSGGVSDLWRCLTFLHTDLFFYLALILPQAAAKSVLLTGYCVRFGLCCSAMYYFMSEHIRISKFASALLAVMYAFSSQLVLTAQVPALMNMAIMLPVVMSSFDSYLQKRTWKAFILVCLSVFGMCFSGGFGVITGVPAVLMIGFLMCISLYKSFGMMFVSWIKLVAGVLVGLALDMAFAIPGFINLDPNVDFVKSLEDARVTYTVLDLIRGTYMLRSGSIYQNGVPVFYVGILTLLAVLAFALNDRIPLRLKVTTAVFAVITHITCCSSYINETLSVYGSSPQMNTSKLICLEILIFFAAGIGLKNAKSLKRGEFIALGLIPLGLFMLSNNSSSGTSLASPILITTFIAIIVEAAVIYASSSGKLTGKARYIVTALIFFFVGVNTAFVLFNNTIQALVVEEYFKTGKYYDTTQTLIYDEDFDIPALNGNRCLIVPADLSIYEPAAGGVEDINYLSAKISGYDLFEEIDIKTTNNRESSYEELGIYRLIDGINEIEYDPYSPEPGERIFAYCSYAIGAELITDSGSGTSDRVFGGPFLTELENVSGAVSVRFVIDSNGESSCRASLYRLNETALSCMESLSGAADSAKFSAELKDVSRVAGINTVLLPYRYDEDNLVKINGVEADTFDFCGITAATCDCTGKKTLNIVTGHGSSEYIPGILISAFAAMCIIAIPVIQRYNEKKKVSGEGT